MEAPKIKSLNKNECCACEACVAICRKNAITLQKDEQGYLYPVINDESCINCGLCNTVCLYSDKSLLNRAEYVYAATTQNLKTAFESASGGVFAEIARQVISNGGIVFGAAMVQEDNTLVTKHIAITTKSELHFLQGSKYVQSRIGSAYKAVEKALKSNVEVLFSGTPCQVSGLKGYLRKEYANLITVDIICHGVPNEQFFQDYLSMIMKQKKGVIKSFKFRDKTKGWGLTAKYDYAKKSGKIKTALIPFRASSYYDMFINGETYRENCYSCPFACKERVGDLTLGDFWGIKKQHPELMIFAGGVYSEDIGISCVLVNTEKGKYMIERISKQLYMNQSTIEKVAAENHQLICPTSRPRTRDEIMDLYANAGYEAVEKYFQRRVGMKIYYYKLKNSIPKPVKNIIKLILKRS